VPHRSQHLLSRRNLLQLTGATSLGALAGCTGQLPGSDDGARAVRCRPRDSHGRAGYISEPHCGVRVDSTIPDTSTTNWMYEGQFRDRSYAFRRVTYSASN